MHRSILSKRQEKKAPSVLTGNAYLFTFSKHLFFYCLRVRSHSFVRNKKKQKQRNHRSALEAWVSIARSISIENRREAENIDLLKTCASFLCFITNILLWSSISISYLYLCRNWVCVTCVTTIKAKQLRRGLEHWNVKQREPIVLSTLRWIWCAFSVKKKIAVSVVGDRI